jgi:hypothetical protein
MEEKKVTKKGIRFVKKHLVKIVVLVVCVLVVGMAWVYHKKHSDPRSRAIAEGMMVLENVKKLQIIPDEKPVIATIDDAEKMMKEQPFYAGVQNGDKLLIFPKSQRAVIYSPKRNIIVNSGPFVLDTK